MGKRACYYKGVRLWEVFQDWYPWASRTGEGSHDGITQVWVYLNPESPNFLRDPVVECVIEPITDHGDLDTLTTMDVLCLDVETHLRANAKSLGHLSYCLDDDRKADVSGSFAAGLRALLADPGRDEAAAAMGEEVRAAHTFGHRANVIHDAVNYLIHDYVAYKSELLWTVRRRREERGTGAGIPETAGATKTEPAAASSARRRRRNQRARGVERAGENRR